MSYATLAYVPSIPRLHPDAFLRSLSAYKTRYPVILYGEDQELKIPDPAPAKLSKNKVAVNNLVFLAGLGIAQTNGIKRFIYLETDCRVGCDYWDEKMFAEAEPHKDSFAVGSPAVYNRKAMTRLQEQTIDSYCKSYENAVGIPVANFQAKVPRPIGCWFLMGAGCVYSTAIAADIFLGFERDMADKAVQKPAFDLFFGMRCVQLFGINAPKKLPFLTCSFSSYGTKVSTEEERIRWLKEKRFCLIHQVKSNNDCL